jgi:hypothetical protein
MGILGKIRNKMSSSQATFAPSQFHPLTPANIPRYRKQRGVNLGAWFVQEDWISWSPFRNAAQPGRSDLDIVRGGDAKRILEEHWDSWMTEDDWGWIKERGFNCVRLPVSGVDAVFGEIQADRDRSVTIIWPAFALKPSTTPTSIPTATSSQGLGIASNVPFRLPPRTASVSSSTSTLPPVVRTTTVSPLQLAMQSSVYSLRM